MTFAERLVETLKENGWTVTTAESCTGGAIAAMIVDVPGASAVLREAYITYCDDAKEKLLGVSRETLLLDTAVSRQCAAEMAEGAARRAGADLAVSATGLAGPDGGTEDTPVGTVFIGCAFQDSVTVRRFFFEGSRNEIRRQAAEAAVMLALQCVG